MQLFRILLTTLCLCLNVFMVSAGDKTPLTGSPVTIATSYQLHSKVLEQDRRINVYLPPGSDQGKEQFPVLYLLDGGVAEDFIHITGIASLAADFRKIRPFVVVGIEGIDRYHDLTAPSKVERDKKDLPTSGGSAAFRTFIATELKPWVKDHFPVTEESVLIGESAAGLFVTETLLLQPELFSAFIAISPSLWWDDESLARSAPQLLEEKGKFENRRLFLSIADEGGTMQGGVDKLVKAIRDHAPETFKFTYAPMPHENHGTIFHPAALAGIRNIFAIP